MSTEYEFGKRSREEQAAKDAQMKAAKEAQQQEIADLRTKLDEENRQFASRNPNVKDVLTAYANTVNKNRNVNVHTALEGRMVSSEGGYTSLVIVYENEKSGELQVRYNGDATDYDPKIREHAEEIAEYIRSGTNKNVTLSDSSKDKKENTSSNSRSAARKESWDKRLHHGSPDRPGKG